jgi:hypothetical protein
MTPAAFAFLSPKRPPPEAHAATRERPSMPTPGRALPAARRRPAFLLPKIPPPEAHAAPRDAARAC